MDPDHDNEFLPAYLPNARMGGLREQAGAITTHAYLDRFPTTDTNRNRHRVSETMKRFLALYIPELTSRPLEDGSFRLPIMENPGCAACHDIMDPMAAGFQSWAPKTASVRMVRVRRLIHWGKCIWRPTIRRMQKATATTRMVDAGTATARRRALATRRCRTATTTRKRRNGWAIRWPRLTLRVGWRPLLVEGLDQSRTAARSDGYDRPRCSRPAAAYNGQHEEFMAIAARFAGTNYNVKELLVDLVVSKNLRANSVTGTVTAQRAAQLADTGSYSLLSSTMLNQKFVGLFGSGVAEFNNPIAGAALSFSDFDGTARKSRAQTYTVNQISVVDRIAAMYSPGWVMADFNKPNANRLLFPGLTMADTPATKAGSDKILANISICTKCCGKSLSRPRMPKCSARTTCCSTSRTIARTVPARPVVVPVNDTNDADFHGARVGCGHRSTWWATSNS